MASEAAADERLNGLYQRHRRAIVAYCRRRVAEESVADLVSEVFLVAWRRIGDVPEGAELPWLYGVARNVVSNHHRGHRRRSRLMAALTAQPPETGEDAEVLVVRRADEKMVLQALAALSPLDQEVLRLRAWEELSSAEIGTVLQLSSAAVDMRLTRAKRRLRRSLRSLGYFESVSSPRIVRNGGSS